MVSPPTGGERPASSLGLAVDRSVRFPYTVPSSQIPRRSSRMRFVILGPTRTCTRFHPFLWWDGWWLEFGRPQSLHDSGRPLLIRGVVRRPSPSANLTTSGAPVVGPVVAAAPLQQVPQRRPRDEPSLVTTLQCLLRKSGFSRGSAVEMSGCVSKSTSRLYQVKWILFCGWCCGRGVAPVNATVPLIVDFLVHLRCDKGLSVSAVKGYRSALNSVFALKGMDLADS